MSEIVKFEVTKIAEIIGTEKHIIKMLSNEYVSIDADEHIIGVSYYTPRDKEFEEYITQFCDIFDSERDTIYCRSCDLMSEWVIEEWRSWSKGEKVDNLVQDWDDITKEFGKEITEDNIIDVIVDYCLEESYVCYDVDVTYTAFVEAFNLAREVIEEYITRDEEFIERIEEKIYDMMSSDDVDRMEDLALYVVGRKDLNLTDEEVVICSKVACLI